MKGNEHRYPAVSIIVPVYNIAPYLGQCLQSIADQKQSLFELIVINDGSSDDSQAIIDSFVPLFADIKSIIQPNSGVSAARNRGLELASGAYILFVDGDDTLRPGAVESLWQTANDNNLDMVRGNGFNYIDKDGIDRGGKRWPLQLAPINGRDYLIKKTKRKAMASATWMQLTCRDLIEQTGQRFDPVFRVGQDYVFFMPLFLTAKRVADIDLCYYNYRHYSDSGSKSNLKKTLRIDVLKINYTRRLDKRFDLTVRQRYWLYSYLSYILSSARHTIAGQPTASRTRSLLLAWLRAHPALLWLHPLYSAAFLFFVAAPRLYCRLEIYFKRFIKKQMQK